MRYILILAALVATTQGWLPGPNDPGIPGRMAGYPYRRALLDTMLETLENFAGELLEDDDYLDLMEEAEDIYNTPSVPYLDCGGCMILVNGVRAFLNQGMDYWDIRDTVLDACYQIVNSTEPNSRYDVLCPGVCDNYGPHVMYVFNTSEDSARDICTLHNNCDPVLDPEPDPTTEAPIPDMREKPEVPSRRLPSKTRQSKSGKPNIEGAIKLAVVADIHVDEEYMEGEGVDCGLPVCCREDYPGEGEADYWGDYACNIPPHTVEHLLSFINDQEPDIVVYVGDSPPHDLWLETQERQVHVTQWVAECIDRNFPGLPAYASIGNHETFPTNLYYSPRPEIQEFNEAFGQAWASMSGFTEEQLQTVNHAGYYSVLVPGFPGLRVITYNSNYGYTDNFYGALLQDDEGYLDMKDYVEDELEKARENGEKVIFVGHHKSGGGGNFIFFGRWVTDTATEYGDIILMHLLGHSHSDNFRMTTDLETGDVFNVQSSLPAVGTRGSINPSARIMYLDPDTYTPLDYDQYNIDLEAAMGSPEDPDIRLFYTASVEYALPDLTPASYGDFVDRMEEDQDLFERYRYLERTGTSTPGSCTGTCKDNAMCSFRTTAYEDYKRCIGDW